MRARLDPPKQVQGLGCTAHAARCRQEIRRRVRYGLVQPALRRCTVLPAADTVLAADDEVVMTRPVTLPASECQPLAAPMPIDLGAPAEGDASLVGCTPFGPSMIPCGHGRDMCAQVVLW